jgi:hypothetical protein
MTPEAAERLSTQLSTVAQYETLRMAMLGELLPPEARSGLMLFLRRGMWGWARTLAAASAQHERILSSSLSRKGPSEHRAVIHLFAAMAMKTNSRRTL